MIVPFFGPPGRTLW